MQELTINFFNLEQININFDGEKFISISVIGLLKDGLLVLI